MPLAKQEYVSIDDRLVTVQHNLDTIQLALESTTYILAGIIAERSNYRAVQSHVKANLTPP